MASAGLNALVGQFIFHADGTSRLSAGDSQPSINFSVDVPNHPIHRAYLDAELERELDRLSREAFGLGVAVDRYAGAAIPIRIGNRPVFEHIDGLPTRGYIDALHAMPRIEDQGDGVRSYLGLLLHILAGVHQIVLVDEPEAFLHPPQARRLGGILAQKGQALQAFIATHSSDVVQGALDAASPTTIIRVTREGDINRAAVLPPDAVKELWADPILRYSNVLDGLFHDVVVICEGDADCTYYAAMLDALEKPSTSEKPRERDAQILFTHCGGKARIASVAKALRAVSVPVVVVADFDILREVRDVAKIVETLGEESITFDADAAVVRAALNNDVRPLRRIPLKDELLRTIDDLPGEIIDQKAAQALRGLIKAENGWDKAKKAGVAAVPQGEASAACGRLILALREIGLLVVPVGELERFAPEVGGHGPGWVANVMELGLHAAPGREASEFALALWNAALDASGLLNVASNERDSA